MDDLIICKRCGSDACYKQEVNENVTNYACYGCGFISNTLMKDGHEYWEQQLETLPELHKDLVFKDKDDQYWMPNTVNQHKQGMVFANGKTVDNWKWTAVKAVKVSKDEQIKFPIPGKPGEYYEWRMDMEHMVDFEEKDYMEALSYIGVLP
jgi:hypothetical protein